MRIGIHYMSILKKTSTTDPICMTMKTNFQTYNKILERNFRLAKRNYYYICFNNYNKYIKSTWRTIKQVLGRSNVNNEYPEKIKHKNKIETDKYAIANTFNEYFTNISPSLASSIITKGLSSHKHYLTNKTDTIFRFVHVTEDEIAKRISNLKTKNSSGFYGISTKLLKIIKEEMIKLLTRIVNHA